VAELPQHGDESRGCAVIPPFEGRNQHSMPAAADPEIQTSFNTDVLAVTLPKKLAAQKPEKKIQIQAAMAVPIGRSTETRYVRSID
jgi:hypothetical protein